jgi:hypothetical protein
VKILSEGSFENVGNELLTTISSYSEATNHTSFYNYTLNPSGRFIKVKGTLVVEQG